MHIIPHILFWAALIWFPTAQATNLDDLPVGLTDKICGYLLTKADFDTLALVNRALHRYASEHRAKRFTFNFRLDFLCSRQYFERCKHWGWQKASFKVNAAFVDSWPMLPTVISGYMLPQLATGKPAAVKSLSIIYGALCDLPEDLEQFTNLESLKLYGNNLSNADWRRLSKLTSLTDLHIDGCRLIHVPAQIAELPNLRTLNLSDNVLLKHDTLAVLTGCMQLTHLDLRNTGLEKVPEYIGALANLKILF